MIKEKGGNKQTKLLLSNITGKPPEPYKVKIQQNLNTILRLPHQLITTTSHTTPRAEA